MKALGLLGGLLFAITIAALALHVPGADNVGSPLRVHLFVGLVATSVVVYFVAVRYVLRVRIHSRATWLVLGIALILRVSLLPSPPFLSSDIYRYVWDGRVQATGINPYRYVPADPALAALRDPDIYPLINRKDYARTIYPPAAQAVFALVAQVSESVIGMKLAMLAFEAVGIVSLVGLLGLAGLPSERVLIYAWNPLPLWSFALDGHVDAIAIGFLGLALLARARRRDGLGGAILALASLVKFAPAAIAPAFVRGGSLWRPLLAATVVVILLYVIYLSVGSQVFGFLSTYGVEEGYTDGHGYWLLAGLAHIVSLPPWAPRGYLLCAGGGLLALAIKIAWLAPQETRSDTIRLCRDGAVLAAATTIVMHPHYTWYYAWLALPSAVAPIPAVIWLSAAPVLFYLNPLNEHFFWASLVFVPTFILAILGARRNKTAPSIVRPVDKRNTVCRLPLP